MKTVKKPLRSLKSRLSVKPSKFPIYFAHDCRGTFRTSPDN